MARGMSRVFNLGLIISCEIDGENSVTVEWKGDLVIYPRCTVARDQICEKFLELSVAKSADLSDLKKIGLE